MAAIKPIAIYGSFIGPNPLKVALILEVLGLPHEDIEVPYGEVKSPSYLAINPNGRLPSIHDPNTGITVWESGAIIEYLIERYDTTEPRKLSFAPKTPEAEHARQWLYLQTTGQGPYYGQGYWFMKFHSEKIQSAVDRYVNEAKRVTGVLDGWLAKQKEEFKGEPGDGPWLVGNKLSYADLAFIPWQRGARLGFGHLGFDAKEFPYENDWYERMINIPAVKAMLEKEQKRRAEIDAQKK
ncbi:glutathione S-transferase [Talaromyces proteolyticus]|uniref:Glutathione S-transferase n=1 Tax=Talaromyces proteolyticus TaxID=1131652 RepID=A0AAD4KYM7_9EURO|nr:glutathione S-transferase [Talaromyces proteolyticus]KAH8703372.1 glutathione S-transferase [Talaromyces proteolyticus]